MSDLREKVLALRAEMAVGTPTMNKALDRLALAVAALVLTDYAERMERAGQPAAAVGAMLLAETLK